LGVDLSYYIEKFIRVVDLSSCSDLKTIIFALAKYLDTIVYLKDYPWLISVINVSNKYEKEDLDIYLNYMESIFNEIPKLLSNPDNINLILNNCFRLLEIFKNDPYYIIERTILYPKVTSVLITYCEIKGIELKVAETPKIQVPEKPKVEPIVTPNEIIKKTIEMPKKEEKIEVKSYSRTNDDGYIDRYSTKGFSKSVFSFLGVGNDPDKFNYVMQNLSLMEIRTLKSYFGNNYEKKYNDSSVCFNDLITKCKGLIKCYNNHVNPYYINVDLSQNLFYLFKGARREDIYEFLITVAPEKVNFLGKFFDLKTGESRNKVDVDDYQLFRLRILLSSLDSYIKYQEKNTSKEIAI
jgi:hypothetical protein